MGEGGRTRDPLAFVDVPSCLAQNDCDEMLVNRPDSSGTGSPHMGDLFSRKKQKKPGMRGCARELDGGGRVRKKEGAASDSAPSEMYVCAL